MSAKELIANAAAFTVLAFVGSTGVWQIWLHFCETRPKPLPRLSPNELVKRLCLNNAKVIDDIYAIANRQLEVEDRREANLSSKAATLLSASGVSLTFVLGFAALFAQKSDFFKSLPSLARKCVFLFYLGSFFAGLLASGCAAWSLRVRKSKTVSEADVFGSILRDAESADTDDVGTAMYRRYLVAHIWQVYTDTFDVHESRARTLWYGQLSFVAFLLTLIPPALGVAYAVVNTVSSGPG